MNYKFLGGVIVAIFICQILAWDWDSEAETQPWAIGAAVVGVVVAGVSCLIWRDGWRALFYGVKSAFIVSMLGVVTRFSPGWHDSVLDSIL